MKILVRSWNGKVYEWIDATFDEHAKSFKHEGYNIKETNIVSVFEDNRNAFVKCSVCGKVFKKGDPAIEAHTTRINDNSKCFDCVHLRRTNAMEISRKYELVEGNVYKESRVCNVNLTCSASWLYTNINEEAARVGCIYNRCANANMIEFSDFFTEYPDAFERIITSERIEEVGYSEQYRCGSVHEYKLNCRNNVWAVANELGIVDHFIINYKRESYNVCYSKKYHKLFQLNRERYTEWNPDIMPQSSKTLILNKIAELYS